MFTTCMTLSCARGRFARFTIDQTTTCGHGHKAGAKIAGLWSASALMALGTQTQMRSTQMVHTVAMAAASNQGWGKGSEAVALLHLPRMALRKAL